MAMNQTILDNFWDLLNNLEDFYSSGYEHQHPDGPRLREIPAAKSSPPKQDLQEFELEVKGCRLCSSATGAPVFGNGPENPKVMVVSDMPSQEEAGAPFSGEAGDYLAKWLGAINLDRSRDCYVAYLVKCPGRSDGNTVRACFPFLEKQIKILKPTALLCTGLLAARTLTGNISYPLNELRGKTFNYCGIPVIATYHPFEVLEDQGLRRAVWDDLKLLRNAIGC